VLGDVSAIPPRPVSTPPATIDKSTKGLSAGAENQRCRADQKSWRRTQQATKDDSSSRTDISCRFKTPRTPDSTGTLPGFRQFSTFELIDRVLRSQPHLALTREASLAFGVFKSSVCSATRNDFGKSQTIKKAPDRERKRYVGSKATGLACQLASEVP